MVARLNIHGLTALSAKAGTADDVGWVTVSFTDRSGDDVEVTAFTEPEQAFALADAINKLADFVPAESKADEAEAA